MNPLRFVFGAACTIAAIGLCSGQETLAPEPKAEQLEKIVAASRKPPFAVSYRVEADPFTKKPVHSFVIRGDAKDFPEIPFAHEIALSPNPDQQRFGIEAFAATKPVPALRVRFDPLQAAPDWKKFATVESLTLETRLPTSVLLNLESLTTLVGRIPESDLKELKKLKHLKNLATVERVGTAGLKELAVFPALERLLLDAPALTVDGVKALQGARNLKQLGISNVRDEIRPEVLAELSKLTGLTALHLTGVGRDGKDRLLVSLLDSLEALTTLELADVGALSADVRPSAFKSLRTLRLAGSLIDEEVVKDLVNVKSLKELSLSGARLDDSNLAYLRGLQLESLTLTPTKLYRTPNLGTPAGMNFTGVGVARAIKGMKTLTTLSIPGVPLFPPVVVKGKGDDVFDPAPGPVTPAKPPEVDAVATGKQKDEVVAALKSLPALRSLNLRGSGVKEEDLAWIKEMKSLRYLYLDDKVGSPALEKFRKELPNCTVTAFLERPELVGNEPAK